jgi:hypothetical protein
MEKINSKALLIFTTWYSCVMAVNYYLLSVLNWNFIQVLCTSFTLVLFSALVATKIIDYKNKKKDII